MAKINPEKNNHTIILRSVGNRYQGVCYRSTTETYSAQPQAVEAAKFQNYTTEHTQQG